MSGISQKLNLLLSGRAPELVEISLCVYKGTNAESCVGLDLEHGQTAVEESEDTGKSRHMGLWFTFARDPDHSPAYSHAVGAHGHLDGQCNLSYDPRTDNRLIGKPIHFAILRQLTTPEIAAQWTTYVDFDRNDVEIDCQQWICKVLEAAAKAKLISDEDCDKGTDLVLEAIMSAPDYQSSFATNDT